MKLAITCLLLTLTACFATQSTEHVTRLSGKDLGTVLQNTHDFWIVLVLAAPEKCGERCAAAAESFEKVASKSSDVFHFGTMDVFDMLPGAGPDGDDIDVRGAFNMSAVPSLLLYQIGHKTLLKPLQLDPQSTGYLLQSPKTLYTQLTMFVPSLVQPVTQHSLTRFLTEEDATLPRVLLFTEKKETSLLFKKLSLDLHRHALLGQTPALDKQLVQKFGVTKFPTLLVSPAGTPLDATATSYQWTEYDGEMSYTALKNFLGKAIPPVVPPALREQADFDKHCLAGGAGVCFVAVLPPQSACPSCHSAVNSVLSESFLKVDLPSSAGAAPTAVGLPLRFMWTNGEAQKDFVSAFDRLQTPGLVALNPRKKLYATFVGAFEAAELSSFVRRVMEGSESLSAIHSLPSIQKVAEPTKAPKKASKAKAKKSKKGADEL